MEDNARFLDHSRYFRYLDALRASGATNMFGAAPYLSNEFSLNIIESRKILAAWMQTFDDNA